MHRIMYLKKITELDHCQISKISCGIFHSMCLDETGQSLYSFGRGDSGQLGVTATRPDVGYFKDTPQLIKFPSLDDSPPVIEQISCGGNHTLVVTDDGTVYSWGYGDMGALGHGEEKDEYQPRKVDIMEGVNRLRKKQNLSSLLAKVHSVVGGGQHSAIVASTS
jgi:regulator of chromosome condensation